MIDFLLSVSSQSFPMYILEARNVSGEWFRFTHQPFYTKEAAETHRLEVPGYFPEVDIQRLRAAEYTESMWQADLIKEVMKDTNLVQRLLTVIRPETIVESLKSDQLTTKDADR